MFKVDMTNSTIACTLIRCLVIDVSCGKCCGTTEYLSCSLPLAEYTPSFKLYLVQTTVLIVIDEAA